MRPSPAHGEPKIYLVGSGIASLAAATFLIRDAGIAGRNITIFEEATHLGGHSGGPLSTDSDAGYVMQASLMFESKYLCTHDLFSSIPAPHTRRTVTQEISEQSAAARRGLLSHVLLDGRRVHTPKFGLGDRHIRKLERIGLEPEAALGRSSIKDHFDQEFFLTAFWILWCSKLSLQPWHSAAEFRRCLLRFMKGPPDFSQLHSVRMVFDQTESMVRPLTRWLAKHSVHFCTSSKVVDLGFCQSGDGYTVDTIYLERAHSRSLIHVTGEDRLFVTLGSITDSASLGAEDRAPVRTLVPSGGGWSLWKRIADGKPNFGRPEIFTSHVTGSMGVSFTTTVRDPEFFQAIRAVCGKDVKEGSMVTLATSNWLTSIVLPTQPHFAKQPAGVEVFWGRGLRVDRPGNFVPKLMTMCTGREIMAEIAGHLKCDARGLKVLDSCTCIPCFMPFITSQLLCRSNEDRPKVVPEGSKNLAFIGQFCEMAEDVTSTMEYSIRSAQAAVYSLLKLGRVPPPVFKGRDDYRLAIRALVAFH